MCDFDAGDFDRWKWVEEKMRKARKDRVCDCCDARIPVGHHYVNHSSLTEYVEHQDWCLRCFEAMNEFGEAHHMRFVPGALEEFLSECVREDESPRWKQLLAQINTRRLASAEGVSP